MSNTATEWMKMPFSFDNGPAARAAIGLIALASDMVCEPELSTILPRDGVGLYVNRIQMPKVATVNTLSQIKTHLTDAASLLVPDDHLDVIAFGCTAASIFVGTETVAEQVRLGRPCVAYTDPMTAGIKGLKALGCQRIALLTPNIDEVNVEMEGYMVKQGFDVIAKGSFKQLGDPQMCRIPPDAIYNAGLTLGQAEVDGLFISCTALRVSSIIADLEATLGKPVVTSNQALAWDCLRLAGCSDRVEGFGRLLTI